MARCNSRRSRIFLALLLAGLLPLSACSRLSDSREAPGDEAANSVPPEQEEQPPAEPPPPEPVPVEVEANLDEDEETPASSSRLAGGPDAEDRAPPEAWFLVRSEHALPQLRVRLFDEAGRMVPTQDEAQVGQGSRYRLHPSEPLVPGSLYRLVIDSQEGANLRDVDGTVYLPRTLPFRTLGEKPTPTSPPKRHRGRR